MATEAFSQTTEAISIPVLKNQSANLVLRTNPNLYPQPFVTLVECLKVSILGHALTYAPAIPAAFVHRAHYTSNALFDTNNNVKSVFYEAIDSRGKTKKVQLTKEKFAEALHLPLYKSKEMVIPTAEQLVDMFNAMGYEPQLETISNFKKKQLPDLWWYFFSIFLRCLSGRTSGLDSVSQSFQSLLYGIYFDVKVDFASILWADFCSHINHTLKGTEISNARAKKVSAVDESSDSERTPSANIQAEEEEECQSSPIHDTRPPTPPYTTYPPPPPTTAEQTTTIHTTTSNVPPTTFIQPLRMSLLQKTTIHTTTSNVPPTTFTATITSEQTTTIHTTTSDVPPTTTPETSTIHTTETPPTFTTQIIEPITSLIENPTISAPQTSEPIITTSEPFLTISSSEVDKSLPDFPFGDDYDFDTIISSKPQSTAEAVAAFHMEPITIEEDEGDSLDDSDFILRKQYKVLNRKLDALLQSNTDFDPSKGTEASFEDQMAEAQKALTDKMEKMVKESERRILDQQIKIKRILEGKFNTAVEQVEDTHRLLKEQTEKNFKDLVEKFENSNSEVVKCLTTLNENTSSFNSQYQTGFSKHLSDAHKRIEELTAEQSRSAIIIFENELKKTNVAIASDIIEKLRRTLQPMINVSIKMEKSQSPPPQAIAQADPMAQPS
ncbi:hypothetical protein L1887_32211 [Cichorium endivia]|nr:hypothetical protein L1887_32211 [Cichorium endivia]